MTSYPPCQFATFRILFGCFLTWHFASVIPYANELFGNTPIGHAPRTYPFPDVLSLGDGIIPIKSFLFALVIMAILFTLGVMRRLMAVLIWYGIACLLHQNNAIFNVSLPYIGWLLLACAVIPDGDPLRLWRRSSIKQWTMPADESKTPDRFVDSQIFRQGVIRAHAISKNHEQPFDFLGVRWDRHHGPKKDVSSPHRPADLLHKTRAVTARNHLAGRGFSVKRASQIDIVDEDDGPWGRGGRAAEYIDRVVVRDVTDRPQQAD